MIISIYIYISVSLSVCKSVSVCKSISLSVCKPLSLSVSPYHYYRVSPYYYQGISRIISALSPSVLSIGQQAIAASSLRFWSEMYSPVGMRCALCSLAYTRCAFITRYFCPLFLIHSLETHYPMQISAHSTVNHSFASLAFCSFTHPCKGNLSA